MKTSKKIRELLHIWMASYARELIDEIADEVELLEDVLELQSATIVRQEDICNKATNSKQKTLTINKHQEGE